MEKHTPLHSPSEIMNSLKVQAAGWSPSDWKIQLPKLTPLEIAALIPLAMDVSHSDHWREVLKTILLTINDKASLEAIGAELNSDQFLEILSIMAHSPTKDSEKLSSLLISLTPAVFKETLSLATTEDLDLLKGEAFGEPLLHQISLLSRELDQEIDLLTERAAKFSTDLQANVLTNLTTSQTAALFSSIELLTANIHEVTDLLRNAQKLAWIADRADLIDELSKSKERTQKTLLYVIGNREAETVDETDLWSQLNRKINRLFSDTNDQGAITLMHDTQPVLDAIVKFSIWYLNDYEEIGILPKGSIDSLEAAASDEERQALRKTLYETATKNLSKVGLDTLYDLKQARIFSKMALKEFLSANQ